MDDELIDELLGLYRRVRDDHDTLDDESIAALILWDLRRCEVIDLAADGFADNAEAIANTHELALKRLRELIRAFRKYRAGD